MQAVWKSWHRPAAAFAALFTVFICSCSEKHNVATLATVNGKPIMLSDLGKLCSITSTAATDVSESFELDYCKMSALNGLINDQILQQEAEKANVSASNDDIELRLSQIKSQYTKEQFQSHLAQAGLTIDELKHEIGRVQTEQALLNKEIDTKVAISDLEIANYYQAHISEFNPSERYFHLAKIVVNADHDSARTLKKLVTIMDLLNSGADFRVVAANYSDDAETSPNGGEMGMVPESRLRDYPAIYSALLKRQSGDFTGIIPVQGSSTASNDSHYDILKVIQIEPAGQHQLADPRVQQDILRTLFISRTNLLRSVYMEILRDRAHVRNYFAENFFTNSSIQ